MRLALISDIHGNGPALDAVIAHASDTDGFLCLGDVVGYGPDPEYCIRRIRELGAAAVAGNHDTVIGTGRIPAAWRDFARAAGEWTHALLSAESLDWLGRLPGALARDSMVAVHELDRSGLSLPLNRMTAPAMLGSRDPRIIVFGHTHVPVVALGRRRALFFRRPQVNLIHPGAGGMEIYFEQEQLLGINPGSVGQPRDGTTGAAYAVVDFPNHVLSLHTVAYDRECLKHHIAEREMPPQLRAGMLAHFNLPQTENLGRTLCPSCLE